MCKLLMIANTTKLTKGTVTKFLNKASHTIATTDKDGFGWAVRGGSGRMLGERYVGNKGIDFPLLMTPPMPEELRIVCKGAEVEKWGEVEDTFAGALLVHARASTNTVCLANSHPHRTKDFTLIHNGNVTHEGKPYKQKSTCDTEHLVHELSHGGIDSMVKHCAGWYAVGAIEHRTGNFYLVKDDRTSLFAVYVKCIDSLVFATSEEHLKTMLKGMKWDYKKTMEVQSNRAFIFNKEGRIIHDQKIEPKVSYYTRGYERKNWGYGGHYDSGTGVQPEYHSKLAESDSKESIREKQLLALVAPTTGDTEAKSSEKTTDTTATSTTLKPADTNGMTRGEPYGDGVSEATLQALSHRSNNDLERELWLAEVTDDMYVFQDGQKRPIDYEAFQGLMNTEQLACSVRNRSTGAFVNVLEFMG